MTELPPEPQLESLPPEAPIATGATVHAGSERGRGGLRLRAARGTIVNAAFLAALTTLGMVKGLIVAGFVTTSEYGAWGIIFVALGTLLGLKQVGVGDKYIQQDEEDQELAFQKAFTLELFSSCAFAALMLALLPLIALAYGIWSIVPAGVVFTLAVPGVALQAPIWVFYRRMDFVRQRSLQAFDPIVSFLVTIPLAAAGAGYWSLVIGLFVGAWASAAAALLWSPFRPRLRYDRGTMHEYFRFSWPLLIAVAGGVAVAQLSIWVGNEALGLAGAGAIALASTLAVYTNKIDSIVTDTLYPAICAVKDRTELLLESFVKSNRLALMWGVPFGVGLALFAVDLVEFGIGDQWKPAVVLIQVMGLTAAANQVGFNWSAFFRARNDTRPMAVASIAALVVFCAVGVPLTFSNGLDGFAIGVATQAVASLAVRAYYVARLFPSLVVWRHFVRAIAPVVPGVAVVFAVRAAEGQRTLALALGELALYLAVTALATLVFERALLREVTGYLRRKPVLESSPA